MKKQMSLGQFIASKRKRLSLTQEELAEKMIVSKSAIAKWETDGGFPDRDNLFKLSEILDVSVDELHHIIEGSNYNKKDFDINITPEIIAVLESYGYKVIRPGDSEDENKAMGKEHYKEKNRS